jgi:hypothetical protein
MFEFLQSVVTLPEPLVTAISAGITLLFGLVLARLVELPVLGWLARLLGQYKDEIAFVVSGAIVTWLNGFLAQIPLAWETVGFLALQLVVAILAALGLLAQYRKARMVRALRS